MFKIVVIPLLKFILILIATIGFCMVILGGLGGISSWMFYGILFIYFAILCVAGMEQRK